MENGQTLDYESDKELVIVGWDGLDAHTSAARWWWSEFNRKGPYGQALMS